MLCIPCLKGPKVNNLLAFSLLEFTKLHLPSSPLSKLLTLHAMGTLGDILLWTNHCDTFPIAHL